MLIVSVSITVSVHASVSASVSVSVLVTVYCYFQHPGALPPPSAQLLQLPFCSVNSGTASLSNLLSPKAEKHRLNVSQVAYSSFVSTAHRLLPRSSSRSTTAAITTTTAVTILLDQLRHRKSQQSPLPKGGEVLPRRTRSALRRMYWHKQAEQHLAMAVHDVPSRDKEAPVAG